MKTYLQFFLIIFCISTFSCGPTKIQMKPNTLQNIQNNNLPIVLVYYNEPNLEINTAAEVAGLAARIQLPTITKNISSFQQRQVEMFVSDLFAKHNGENINFQDLNNVYIPPSYFMLQMFRTYLTKEKGFTSISVINEPEFNDNITELKNKYGDVILLDFKTLGWVVNYYPVNWDKYYYMIAFQGRMINLGNEEIVWQDATGDNSYSQSAKEAPTYSELFDNDAQGFKQRMMISAKKNSEILLNSFSGGN